MTMEELSNVQGRAWEDVDVSSFPCHLAWLLSVEKQNRFY